MLWRFVKGSVFLLLLGVSSLGTGVVCTGEAQATSDCLGVVGMQLSRGLTLTLEQVGESLHALAEAYAALYEKTAPMEDPEKDLWLKGASDKGETVSFRPFSRGEEPAFQSPVPAYLFYGGRSLTPEVTRELKTFVAMVPLFKAAHRTFGYSWVYMTTVHEAFLIYPYLPLAQAVNNLPPTKQGFYRAADFQNRALGWESPYLDLAGAGMMVTASCPVYCKGTLLGVVSRDITMRQLSRSLLAPLADPSGRMVSLIMDKNGLAIAATSTTASEEIERINTREGAAVLYYRTTQGTTSLGKPEAVPSASPLFNGVGEQAVAWAAASPGAVMSRMPVAVAGRVYRAAMVKIPPTGWMLVTIDLQP